MNQAVLTSPFPAWVRRVGVFAPAGIPDPARLQRGLARLGEWGLDVVVAGLAGPHERFLAAPDAVRAGALNELLRAPGVDILLAARGGYGSARILDRIDWDAWRSREVPLVGYSDLTALHLAAYGTGMRRGVVGPMLCNALSREPSDAADAACLDGVFASLRQALSGEPMLARGGLRAVQTGLARGPLVPVNLSVLVSLVGTPWMPDLRGAILVFEDIHEAAYRVDRYLLQLRLGGCLRGVAGLVFGQFTEGEDASWLPEVFADAAAHLVGPVAAGLEFGHGYPSLSLPMGRTACLRVDASEVSLEVEAS